MDKKPDKKEAAKTPPTKKPLPEAVRVRLAVRSQEEEFLLWAAMRDQNEDKFQPRMPPRDPSKPYPCTVCNTEYSSEQKLYNHERSYMHLANIKAALTGR